MAPVSGHCSTHTNRPNRHGQSADSVRRVCLHSSWSCIGVPSVTTSITHPCQRNRRCRRCHAIVRLDATRSSSLPRPGCLLRRSTDADVAGRVNAARAARVTAPCPPLHRSNSDVRQRQLMTVLYCAALVDQLALRLSQLQLHIDASVNDNTKPSSSSSSSSADCDERDVRGPVSSSADRQRRSHSRHSCSTLLRAGLEVDNTSQPCTDERPQITSMLALLRRSTRIPRPIRQSVAMFNTMPYAANSSHLRPS